MSIRYITIKCTSLWRAQWSTHFALVCTSLIAEGPFGNCPLGSVLNSAIRMTQDDILPVVTKGTRYVRYTYLSEVIPKRTQRMRRDTEPMCTRLGNQVPHIIYCYKCKWEDFQNVHIAYWALYRNHVYSLEIASPKYLGDMQFKIRSLIVSIFLIFYLFYSNHVCI